MAKFDLISLILIKPCAPSEKSEIVINKIINNKNLPDDLCCLHRYE